MKRIILTAIFVASTFNAFSQSLNYNDLGILFSKNDNYGTARFTAMSGAFGALGSDVSSVSINPAGGAMAIKSKSSVTLDVNSIKSNVNYYGSTTNTQDEYFNLSQAGGIFVFDSYDSSNWNRFGFFFNYRLKSDFDGSFVSKGKGNYLYFTQNPDEKNVNPYNIGQSQTYIRKTEGQSSEFNVGISGVHDKKLYVGGSLNFHYLDFKEIGKLQEISEDEKQNKLDAFNVQEQRLQGVGFSLGLGVIYKLNQNIRLGLAYETPTWYQEVIEETNIIKQNSQNGSFPNNTKALGFVDIVTTDPDGKSNEINYKTLNQFIKPNAFTFKSPSRLTLSGAFVFAKKGLISADYTCKNYKSIKFNGGGFTEINQSFTEHYRDTHTLNLGTEWRFDKLSLRGGYHYEKNPNLLLGGNTNKDNVRGFSAGLGYNFGNTVLDLSYYQMQNTDYYKLYKLNDLDVNNNNSRITATLTLKL